MTGTPDLFSDSIPEKTCRLCRGTYGAALSVTDAFWTKLAPQAAEQGAAHSEDACPNCVTEKLADLHRYGNIRMTVWADDQTIDTLGTGRRQGWLSAVSKLESFGGAFLPMTTVLDMMEQNPDGTYQFQNGLNVPLKQVFKDYTDEFYRRVEQLRADAPPGGFEDHVVSDNASVGPNTTQDKHG